MSQEPFVIGHCHLLGGAPRARSRQGGQIVPVIAVVLVFAGVLGAGLVRLAAADARRAAAQAAADASALAGAAEGRPAAEAVAGANAAIVVEYRTLGVDVLVVIERRGTRAEARARWGVGPVEARAAPRPGAPTPKLAD